MNFLKNLFNKIINLFKKKAEPVTQVYDIPEPIKPERTFKDKLLESHYQKLRRKRRTRNRIAKFSRRKNREN